MAKAGRKPDADPTIRWDLYIPVTLASAVELLLKDPVRQRVKYGARSELIEGLLRNWLNDRVANRTVTVPLDRDQVQILLDQSVEFHHKGGLYEIPREYAKAFGLLQTATAQQSA